MNTKKTYINLTTCPQEYEGVVYPPSGFVAYADTILIPKPSVINNVPTFLQQHSVVGLPHNSLDDNVYYLVTQKVYKVAQMDLHKLLSKLIVGSAVFNK